jgi:hypothetical protein
VQSADEPEAPQEVVAPLEEQVVASLEEQVAPTVEEVVVPAVEEVATAVEEVAPAVEEVVVPAVEEVATAVEEVAPAVEEVAPAVEEAQDVTQLHVGAAADTSVSDATLDDVAQHVQIHQAPVSTSAAPLRSLGEAAPASHDPVVHASAAEQPPSSNPAASTGRSQANGEQPLATALPQSQEPPGSTLHPQVGTCSVGAGPRMRTTAMLSSLLLHR